MAAWLTGSLRCWTVLPCTVMKLTPAASACLTSSTVRLMSSFTRILMLTGSVVTARTERTIAWTSSGFSMRAAP